MSEAGGRQTDYAEEGAPGAGAVIFVTGATGPTGRHLVRRLAEEGWRVRALVRDEARARQIAAEERWGEAVELVEGELGGGETSRERPGADRLGGEESGAGRAAWRGKLAGAAAVVHTAHIRFAGEVVAACAEAGVGRLVAISSTRRFTRFPETTARQVIAGEAAVEEGCAAAGISWTILRPTMIYGNGRDNNTERLRAWVRRRGWFPVVDGGRALMQPVFYEDVIEAVVRALRRPVATAGRALTLGGATALTWRAMVEAVARDEGRGVRIVREPYWLAICSAWLIRFVPGAPQVDTSHVRRLREDKAFDITEAREALGGWEPVGFEEGLRRRRRINS